MIIAININQQYLSTWGGGHDFRLYATLLQETNCVRHMYKKHNNIQIMFPEFQYIHNTNKTQL